MFLSLVLVPLTRSHRTLTRMCLPLISRMLFIVCLSFSMSLLKVYIFVFASFRALYPSIFCPSLASLAFPIAWRNVLRSIDSICFNYFEHLGTIPREILPLEFEESRSFLCYKIDTESLMYNSLLDTFGIANQIALHYL